MGFGIEIGKCYILREGKESRGVLIIERGTQEEIGYFSTAIQDQDPETPIMERNLSEFIKNYREATIEEIRLELQRLRTVNKRDFKIPLLESILNDQQQRDYRGPIKKDDGYTSQYKRD